MTLNAFAAAAARVVERRRAVALARRFRDAEGLSMAQIAERLGRSPATIKAHFYDPTGRRPGR
jgi:DNA-binding NarL/FixJ family response regulator